MAPEVQGPHGWRAVLAAAAAEAARRGDRRLGTDHLLLSLPAASDSGAAAALGTELKAARRSVSLRSRTEALGAQHILLGLLEASPPDPAAQLLDPLGVDRDAARRRLLPAVACKAI